MVKLATIAFLVCSSVVPVPRADAQPTPESLLRFGPKTTLRVETLSLGRIDGQFLRATADTLSLSVQGSPTLVPLRDVQALWQRGRATKTGAIVGGIVGAIGVSLFVEFLRGLADEPSSSDITVASGVVGGAGGALVGGVIGAAIPKWHRRYP